MNRIIIALLLFAVTAQAQKFPRVLVTTNNASGLASVSNGWLVIESPGGIVLGGVGCTNWPASGGSGSISNILGGGMVQISNGTGPVVTVSVPTNAVQGVIEAYGYRTTDSNAVVAVGSGCSIVAVTNGTVVTYTITVPPSGTDSNTVNALIASGTALNASNWLGWASASNWLHTAFLSINGTSTVAQTALAGWPTNWPWSSITGAPAFVTSSITNGLVSSITGGGTWSLNGGAYTFTPTGITASAQSALDAKANSNSVVTVTGLGSSGSVTVGNGGTINLGNAVLNISTNGATAVVLTNTGTLNFIAGSGLTRTVSNAGSGQANLTMAVDATVVPTNGASPTFTDVTMTRNGYGKLDRQFSVLDGDLAVATNSSTLATTPIGIYLTNGTWFIDGYIAMGQTTNAAGTKANLIFTGTLSATNLLTQFCSTTGSDLNNAAFLHWPAPRNGPGAGFTFIQYPGRSMGVWRFGSLIVTAPGTLSWQAAQQTAIVSNWTWVERGSYLKGERFQ